MKLGAAPLLLWAALLQRWTAALLLGQDPTAPSVYPVSKVVQLLRDMKAQLEKEADSDEEVYEKLACWCQSNDKAKTKAITDAETHLSNLGATIERNTALSATLKVEIDGLGTEVERNQRSLDVATALRQKQKADFIGEEKEMVQSIQALGAAITVLEKHHGGASLLSDRAVREAIATVRAQLQRHPTLLQGAITPRQRRALASFVQAPSADYFDSTPTFKQAYQPQSGEIFGILRQMKETFEADLSESQKEEVEAQEAYADLKAAKQEEINTGKASLQDKKQQLAHSDEALAQAKEDREDTEASLDADQKFLVGLKLQCSMTDQQWEERQKTRQGEVAAIAQAIALLSSDDARDLFSKTFNRMVLLQVSRRSVRSQARERAADVLAAAARRTHSPKLSALAVAARLDAFTRVKKAIDDMVAQMIQEKESEIKHKDFCIEELNKNDRMTAKELHTKKNLESKIAGLEMTILGLNGTITTLEAEIAELQEQRQRAKEDRELEKKEFEAVVAEQKAAEALLQQALDALKTQYSLLPGQASLAQRAVAGRASGGQSPAPPPGFRGYDKSGAAPGVLGLLEQIITDTKLLQQDAMKAEAQAQDTYTKFVQDTTTSVEARQNSIVDRTSELAQGKTDLAQAESELDGTATELGALSKGAGDLHGSCDYVLKNFEVRQEARDQEVEALREAKAFLSGMQ